MNDNKMSNNLDFLLPKTKKVLELLQNSNNDFLTKFVLVGGSALALHIRHRQSEDLDFFTYCDYFNKKEIFEIMKIFNQSEILNETNDLIDLLLDGVKVTFFNAKWSFLKYKDAKKGKISIAHIEHIAAMKVNTLFLRAKFRDYYDLYAISKIIPLNEIFEFSKQIVEGLNFKLFSVSIIYTDDLDDDNIDYLQPKYSITKNEISNYFIDELKKMNIE